MNQIIIISMTWKRIRYTATVNQNKLKSLTSEPHFIIIILTPLLKIDDLKI
jgi:hypothetical protein